jgi:hypothetical protein
MNSSGPQQTLKVGPSIPTAPQFLKFLGIGITEGRSEVEFVMGQISSSQHRPLIDELPGFLAMFILQREEDGTFLFSDTGSVTYGLGDNIRLAFSEWLESALELRTMYSEDSKILSPGVATTLQTLERVLERS